MTDLSAGNAFNQLFFNKTSKNQFGEIRQIYESLGHLQIQI